MAKSDMGENIVRYGNVTVSRTDLVRAVVIIALAVSCLVLSWFAFFGPLGTISSLLLFIPILYAAYSFPRRGLIVAGACSIAYQAIGYYYMYPDMVGMLGITGEAIIFIAVAAIMAGYIEQSRSGEARYRAVFEHSQLGIIIFDTTTFAITQANGMIAAMLNYSPEELAAKSFLDLFLTPREKSRFLERIAKETTTSDFESRFATKDGASCWVNIFWGPIGGTLVSCSVMNINSRKLAEKMNNDNMMKYRQLAESSPTSILIVQNGYIRFANPAATAFLGYSAAELTGKNLASFIEPGDLEGFNEFAAKLVQKLPAKLTRECRLVTKSGEVHTAALFTTQITHMESPATLINMVDISEKQRLEDKIHLDNERRRGIIVTVAHELRTPLQPILGYLNLLISDAEGFGIQAETKKILERCLVSVDRERQIINQMLDLSVLESGKIQLNCTKFPLAPLVKKVLDTGGYAGKADLTVAVEDSVTLTGDSERLFSVLDSLLSNAVNYSKPPRKIGIFYRTTIEDNQHHISVRDNGIGIPHDQFTSIFEPFQLADGTVLSRKYDRLGLSLSIVKKIVQMHGGSITVESVVNAGSTFTIHLPKEVHHDA
jgi:PAS domain S-box-containing protein